jgi:hypothetical protein
MLWCGLCEDARQSAVEPAHSKTKSLHLPVRQMEALSFVFSLQC